MLIYKTHKTIQKQMNKEIFNIPVYRNQYSNSKQKNILCSVLMESGFVDYKDAGLPTRKFEPRFINESAEKFIDKPLTLEHNKYGRIILGKVVDVVFNYGGFILPSGELQEKDCKIWVFYEINLDALQQCGLTIDDVKNNYGVSTDYKDLKFTVINSPTVNGFFNHNGCYQKVYDGQPNELTLTEKPRINDCCEALNSISDDNLQKNFDLQEQKEKDKTVLNADIMADEANKNETQKDDKIEALEKEIKELKEAVNSMCAKNSQEDEKESQNSESDGVILQKILEVGQEILAELKSKKAENSEEEKKEEEAKNSEEEKKTNIDEALTTSLNSMNVGSQRSKKYEWECED